jgi:hypothetical protein
MRTALIWCALVLSAWCVPGWSSLQTANFTAQFPNAPEQSQSQQDTLIGSVKTYLYSSTSEQACYSLASTEIPRAALLFASGSVVEDAKKALLADCSGQEVSWQEMRRYSGGRELCYRYAEGQGKAQFFLISGRLYVLDMRTKSGTDLTSAHLFFDSFQPAPLARK